jgi:multidrug efflux pump subunit AcrB
VRERWNISRIAIRFAFVTGAVWLAVCVFGVAAFISLKYTLLPDLSIPVILVEAKTSTHLDALNVERTITIPLERLLRQSRSSDVRSTTKAGDVAFSLSFDVGNTLDQRRARVDALLATYHPPPDVSLKVTSIDINETAVTTFAVTEKDTNRLLIDAGILYRQAVPAFQSIPGVLRAELIGADPTTSVRFNGQDAVMLRIVKKGGANTLDLADDIDVVASRVRARLGIPLIVATTQTPYIREASHATTDALGIAMALSILVVFPFLRNVRATLISAIAIPVSLSATAIAMAAFHFNLETITLLALTLVTGVIVDDAIVDVENIMRHIEFGESPRVAAERATDEIGLTVTGATFTIVAVFLPIAFMTGTLGQFFKPFGLTASVAVLTSLAVARTLSPMLAAYLLPAAPKRREVHPIAPAVYSRILHWSLGHRALVISVAVASFVAGLAIIPLIPKGFVPHLDRGTFIVHVAYNGLSSHRVRATTHAAQLASASILRDPDVANVLAAVGDRGDPALATITVTLKTNRLAKTIVVEDRVRAALPPIPSATVSVEDVPFVDTGVNRPVQLTIADASLAVLSQGSIALVQRLRHEPGFVDVSASGLTYAGGVPTRIDREDGKRIVNVSADLVNVSVGDAAARAETIAKTVLPRSATFSFAGESGDVVSTFGSFGAMLGLSTASIVVVLGLLFRGWRAPLVIVLALPLSIVGALVALFVVRADFGIISLMGVIFLFGLVNKNAILLVDAIEQRRRAGMERTAAITEAATRRFRPIIMTTAATILGMLPIAIGFGAGAELRSPMAIAIIGGLISSTVLSLVVIPVAYSLVDRRTTA